MKGGVYYLIKRKINSKSDLAYYEVAEFMSEYINSNTIIVCIGTDKCIGDCLGPLVGTMLKEKLFPLPIFGTLNYPIHALNLDKELKQIKLLHPTSNIVGIDACLGDIHSIGEIHTRNYAIHPGKGVGKYLPDVGDTSIIGIVDTSDASEFFTSRSIRLNLVFEMAQVTSSGLIEAYNIFSKTKIINGHT